MTDGTKTNPAFHWTGVPNVLFERYMHELETVDWVVLMAIVRKIMGYHKLHDAIALSTLEGMTHLCHKTVEDAIASLESKGLITVRRATGKTNVYELSFDLAEECGPGYDVATPGYDVATPPSYDVATQKKQEKENININSGFLKEVCEKNGMEETDPLILHSPAGQSGLSQEDVEFWVAKVAQVRAKLGELVPPAGQTAPRTAEDITRAAGLAMRTASDAPHIPGLERYPEEVRGVLACFCELWDLTPPRAFGGTRGEYADWVRGARELIDACGEFEPQSVLRDYHKKWAAVEKPYDVGRPGSIQKMVRAYAGELRRKAAQGAAETPKDVYVNNGGQYFYV